jgi:hypothetical protein
VFSGSGNNFAINQQSVICGSGSKFLCHGVCRELKMIVKFGEIYELQYLESKETYKIQVTLFVIAERQKRVCFMITVEFSNFIVTQELI